MSEWFILFQIFGKHNNYSRYSTAGWHKLWQAVKRLARTDRIWEAHEVSPAVLRRLRPSSVLSCASVGTKQSENTAFLLQKCQKTNNVFPPKNLIYGILVANVARISIHALWGQKSGSSQYSQYSQHSQTSAFLGWLSRIFFNQKLGSKISYIVYVWQYLPNIVYISLVSLKRILLRPGHNSCCELLQHHLCNLGQLAQCIEGSETIWVLNILLAPTGALLVIMVCYDITYISAAAKAEKSWLQ